jgi:hypothetical protein
MHQFLEKIELDCQGDLLVVHGFGQVGIGVAGHALVVGNGPFLFGTAGVGLGAIAASVSANCASRMPRIKGRKFPSKTREGVQSLERFASMALIAF